MIERRLERTLVERIHGGKAIIVVGARQTGKTTLIRRVLEGREHLFLNGDDPSVRTLLTEANSQQLNTTGTGKQGRGSKAEGYVMHRGNFRDFVGDSDSSSSP